VASALTRWPIGTRKSGLWHECTRFVFFPGHNDRRMVFTDLLHCFCQILSNRSPNVVLNYLSHLESAFFILKVRRSDIAGKKIFEIGEKYYFEDLGLRHTIIGYRQADIGRILENLVFIHLKRSGYDVTVGRIGGKEIDFSCEKKGERLYVQVAYMITDQRVHDREFGNLLEIKDNFTKIVVSMDEITGGTFKGIKHAYPISTGLSGSAGLDFACALS